MPLATHNRDAVGQRMRGRAVKVVGVGGVGSWVGPPLVKFLASYAPGSSVWFIDGDRYEEANRQRALFRGAPGGNKAQVQARELAEVFGDRVNILPVARYVTPRNARDLFDEGDVIFCAVDNHSSRRTVARAAARLRDSVLISGGNDGIGEGRAGTFGSVLLQVRRDGVNITNPIWRFHPEIASPSDRRPDELGCGELVESVPQLVFTNLAVAAAMCAAFYGWLVRDAPAYEELCLDILAGRSVPLLRLVRRESAAK